MDASAVPAVDVPASSFDFLFDLGAGLAGAGLPAAAADAVAAAGGKHAIRSSSRLYSSRAYTLPALTFSAYQQHYFHQLVHARMTKQAREDTFRDMDRLH